ncbi:hypothetical protein [Chryseobacterium viscerum]|uniref:Carboxypeptidase regulatory-like domain-containing protein n=1 Tax=Chryseobacterium viscerum TaxID=1037377 RepID=A0A316W9Y5_9FLAO|nr:hypothetical protein [Chryseobacterium viscerum]PWN58171.1 hypothetical protein C1634_024700 [Chryseobacterium viscerum]
MKFLLLTIMLFFFSNLFSQQIISGKITNEDDFLLPQVLVINITQNQQVYSNFSGQFSIEGKAGDKIRFVKEKYERLNITVVLDGNINNQHIRMTKIPQAIEEVKIFKLSGDLRKDSKMLTKGDKAKEVRDAVGLPQPVGKLRPKPAEVKQVVIMAVTGTLDIQALYDLISGDARRMKRWYKYDDLQDDILWIRDRVDDQDFIRIGIPKERISEFIEFSFTNNSQVRYFVKQKNLESALARMEESISVFVERLTKEGSSEK